MGKAARSFVLRTSYFVLLASVGCQPARPYQPEKPADAPPPDAAPAVEDPSLGWHDVRPGALAPEVPIEFVHESDGEAWTKLPDRLWNLPPTEAERAAAALVLFPGAAAPLATMEMEKAVRIKVPAGLDNPRAFLPEPDANPPTLNKWQLGRALFYDKSWLGDGRSCASCHDPASGFADHASVHDGANTPTLVNCVFNRRQFWDGRVESLEEVVQRTAADETTPPDKLPPHVWSGGVRRLRASATFLDLFQRAFGGDPTADGVGKALATYLRTLLAADSVHDRAVRARDADHASELKVEHYEKALDDAALKRMGLDKEPKADAAKKIYRGYRLFHDLEERKTGCAGCHADRDGRGEFTDGGFHNLGVGFTWPEHPEVGKEPGRFASLPLGRKDLGMIGAYKTPTLRGLPRTGPYFHDGSAATLEDAVRFHLAGGRTSEYLDPRLVAVELPPEDFADLVLFLRALEGGEVDPAVATPSTE